ncbi:MAG: glutathione S-transferase [Azospirillum sp.]|nr:glutathione S-transferase [Azospirillum sp.]
MQLIGMLDSPYVRRVAISLLRLGVPFEHRSLSVFRTFDEFRSINPVVKAPTLVTDDGTVLIDSTLILDYVETVVASGRSLMPVGGAARCRALRLVGLGLAACEKAVSIYYERTLRPAEKQHRPWLDRVQGQMDAAWDALEQDAAGADSWLLGDQLMQPDITVAVAWRFANFIIPDCVVARTALDRLSARAEQLPEFVATPLV